MNLDNLSYAIGEIFESRGRRHPGWLRTHRVLCEQADRFPDDPDAVLEHSLVALGLEP